MAVSINFRGKAGTGGGDSGGGGKSRLHRAFDDLMDHPNPATQQQFEEDYAMADPSSNLFNPRKVLSNRNNLKNYANKKGMPESRVNAMATKIAKAQMDDFHKHVSQSFEKASSQMARSAQRASETISVTSHRNLLNQFGRISNAQSVIQRVSGGRFQTPVLAANNLSASGARLATLGGLGASADVALISKLGARGSSAAFSGDRRELRKMEKNLDRIASNTGKEVAVLTKSGASPEAIGAKQRVLNSVSAQREAINRARKFSPNASKLRGGIGGLAEGLGLGAMLENPIGLGVAAAGAFVGAPFMMTAAARKIVSASSPYATLSQQMGRYGRAYGFNKSSVMSSIMPSKGVFPEWMLRSGVTQQEIPGLLSSYGVQFNGKTGFRRLMGAVGFANNLPGFGGMNKNVYAGILGQGAAMGLFSPRGEKKGVSVSIGGMTETSVGNTTTDKQYLATFGRVVQSAVKEGMNRSQVVQFMQSSISSAAGGGALSINQRGLLGFGYRMMGSGAPGARTGASVLNFENQLNAGASAVGKMPVQTMMYYQYMKGKTMKQILGSSYGSVMGTKAGRYAVSSAQGALSHGSPWFAVQDLAQAAKGHPNLQMRIIDSYMHEMHMPAYMRPQITAALGLTSQSGAMEFNARGAAASPLQQEKMAKGALSAATKIGNMSASQINSARYLEANTQGRVFNQMLAANHGNLNGALGSYNGGSPLANARNALAVRNYAKGLGWRGSDKFDPSRAAFYEKALEKAGVSKPEIAAMMRASRANNTNPLLMMGIDSQQALRYANGKMDFNPFYKNGSSSATGPGQVLIGTALGAWKGHPAEQARIRKLYGMVSAASPVMNSNQNIGVRSMSMTAGGQSLQSSKIVFETLGRNLSSVSSGMKDLDTVVGHVTKNIADLGLAAYHATQEIGHGDIAKAYHTWKNVGPQGGEHGYGFGSLP